MMKKFVILCILFILVAGFSFAAEDNLAVKLTVADQTAVSFTKEKFDFAQGSSAVPGHTGFNTETVNESVMPVITLSDTNNYTAIVYASARTNSAAGLTLYLEYDDLKTKGGTYSIPLTVTYDSSSVDYANMSITDINDKEGYGSVSDKIITLTDPMTSNTYGLRAISHKINISVKPEDIANATGTGDEDPYQATLKLTTEYNG